MTQALQHPLVQLLALSAASFLGAWFWHWWKTDRANTEQHGELRDRAVERYVLRREWERCSSDHTRALKELTRRFDTLETRNRDDHRQFFGRFDELRDLIVGMNGAGKRVSDPAGYDPASERCGGGERGGGGHG